MIKNILAVLISRLFFKYAYKTNELVTTRDSNLPAYEYCRLRTRGVKKEPLNLQVSIKSSTKKNPNWERFCAFGSLLGLHV